MNELTIKQEQFINNLIKGYSQVEAYKLAYCADNMKQETCINEASKLMANEKVKTKYNKLLNQVNQNAVMSLEQKRSILLNIATSVETSNIDKLRAIDLDNKMCGAYKVDVFKNIFNSDFVIQHEKDPLIIDIVED